MGYEDLWGIWLRRSDALRRENETCASITDQQYDGKDSERPISVLSVITGAFTGYCFTASHAAAICRIERAFIYDLDVQSKQSAAQ